MANKKIPIGLNPAEAELEQRVDAMMEPVRVKVATSKPVEPQSVPAPKVTPIDIFSDPKTAPVVPEGLLEKISVKKAVNPKTVEALAPKKKAISITDHESGEALPIVTSGASLPSAPALPKSVSEELEESVAANQELPPEPPPEPVSVPVSVTVKEEPRTEEPLPEPENEPDDEQDADEEPAESTEAEEPVAPAAPITPGPPPVVPQLVKYAPAATLPKKAPTPMAGQGVPINDIVVPPLKIDDSRTDAAVDDITTREGDDLLAAEDELKKLSLGAGRRSTKTTKEPRQPLLRIKKRWLVLIIILLVLAIAAAVPASRYAVAGMVIQKEVPVRVVDSVTGKPVSKASVTIQGKTYLTDGEGLATTSLSVGQHTLLINKVYYADATAETFVDFGGAEALTIKLTATGRQVPLVILNNITGKPVAGAEVRILNTSAKTDKDGKTVIVLPTKTPTVDARIASKSFNAKQVKVQVTDKVVPENTFKLTPAGKVYFLSNEQGTIDIVKSNLDGTERKTVVKGTGKEDPNTTLLLASRDWKYVVLKAQRTANQASLYMLDSSNDKLTEFDSGDANFTPIGWHEHTFLYDSVRNTIATSRDGREVIRSYDADRGQLNLLDQSQAEGEGTSFLYQGFYNFYLLGDQLVYNTQWYSSGGADLAKKNTTVRGVSVNGQNKKDLQVLGASGTGYVQSAQSAPREIIYGAYLYADNKTQFFKYEDGEVKESTAVNQASFNKLYPSYVVSPSGRQAIWSETRDGKQVVLIGDVSAVNGRVIPDLVGYKAYGWHSNDYLLLTKNNSEMFIVASNGASAPQKITDYFKPAQNQNSFGYGGL